MSITNRSTSPIASTVDEGEVSHFNSISSRWWDKPETSGLHAMNGLRVPFVCDGLINTGIAKPEYLNTDKPLTDLNILDVGCGGGILSEPLAKLGGNITGLDAAAEVIAVAKHHAALDPSLTINYQLSTIEDHALTNAQKYDAVICSEIIEHVAQKKLFVEACVKCLKSGGSIFFTTFNRTTTAWFCGIIVAEYIIGMIPKGTHEYEKFIAPQQLQQMLEEYDCSTTVLRGMWYRYFSNRWIWSSNDSLTYALQAIKK